MYKKFFIFSMLSLLVMGCSKTEFSNEDFEKQQVNENVEKVFGTAFDKNHDWCTTHKGQVEINNIPSNVAKVQVIAHINEDSAESLVVLNESTVNNTSDLKLSYDAPNEILNLYVASISNDSYEVRKVDGNKVNFANVALTRGNRASAYQLPLGELKIGVIEDSYANVRGWSTGEKLYQMNDYTSQKMAASEYSDEFKGLFRNIIFSYFKNGRKYNNLPLVIKSGYYNEKVYPITTGKDPIIISPVYKNDGGYQEIVNSDLYYYYFKESDVTGDPVEYFKSLPKYKAIQFNQCIKNDDEISKHASYALIYWGDGIPTEETVGSYQFPEGYKIGFMVRAKTTAEGGKKQGELYGDGRLNSEVNFYGNFKSSGLGENGPRVAWLSLNGRMLLCYESGTDSDFNDIILEVEGGLDPIIPIPDIDVNEYTFCFEDRQLGDYDMNDVVIKGKRISPTKVEYTLVACGAHDDIFIKNINGNVINDKKELHKIFGATTNEFINTVTANYDVVKETVTVDSEFSFLDESTQPYIYDETMDKSVKLSKKGEDPHGIMIPYDFKYPKEKVCIKDAYSSFNDWGKNKVLSTDWYLHPNADFVF